MTKESISNLTIINKQNTMKKKTIKVTNNQVKQFEKALKKTLGVKKLSNVKIEILK